MTEQLANHEKKGEALADTGLEADAERARQIVENQAKAAEKEQISVEKIEKRVQEAQPTEAEHVKQKLHIKQEAQSVPPPTTIGKQQALRTYLGQVRHHMSGSDRAFSKFVHNPTVNAISEAASKTIIRPSGILTGGALTLLGSGYYYYATKSTGYSYSFTIALLFFAGGFVVGLLGEMVFKMLTKRHHA